MLTYRPRGKNGIFYIRGQVSLGDKRIDVKEFSSGTSDKDAASHLMAEYETKLRHQLMFGPAAAIASGVMADAFASYLSKAKSMTSDTDVFLDRRSSRGRISVGRRSARSRLSPTTMTRCLACGTPKSSARIT